MNGDSTTGPASRLARLGRTQQQVFKGSVDGRVREAAPIPVKPPPSSAGMFGGLLFVGPDDPGLDSGYDFWFDTDEPVPS